ncbi:MAG: flavodoxin family protein [Tannerella sp.]|jgi:multimeric flavodoxin WrbA|nr:flavodoxin family protein [Tannerella sp.]
MKKVIAINGSPRKGWNTGTLVEEACKGAASQGAKTETIELFGLRYTGCHSCFGCKLAPNLGRCIIRDGLHAVLKKIREADALILGSPIYLGDVSACVRALMERLIFQHISYKTDPPIYKEKETPVLLILTSNCAEEDYAKVGYTQLIKAWQASFERAIGATKVLCCGNTWQVNDYDKYAWSMFDLEAKKQQRATEFPKKCQEAFKLGADLVL